MNTDILSLVRKTLNSYSLIKGLNRFIGIIRIITLSITIFMFGINFFSLFKNM